MTPVRENIQTIVHVKVTALGGDAAEGVELVLEGVGDPTVASAELLDSATASDGIARLEITPYGGVGASTTVTVSAKKSPDAKATATITISQ